MSGITYLTRQNWSEWMIDRDRPISDSTARCDACGRDVTIGKVGGFVPAVDDKPIELVCDRCMIEPPAERAAAALHGWFNSPGVDPAKRTVDAEMLISRMLADGLITRTKDGTIRPRSYGQQAMMLLATLKIREAQGEPNRDR